MKSCYSVHLKVTVEVRNKDLEFPGEEAQCDTLVKETKRGTENRGVEWH